MEFLMKILAIGAHYDDIEIGCGGTILGHLDNKDDVHFAVTSADEFRTGDPDDRYVEQLRSFGHMTLSTKKLHTFSYKDEVHNIIGELDGLWPDIIFTQHEFDTHQDHRRASIIGQAVGRKRHITTLFYDSGSSYDFHPNVFSMIDWNEKVELMNCYKSQIEAGAVNLDIIKKKDAYWASLIMGEDDAYAEGFVVRKMRWMI